VAPQEIGEQDHTIRVCCPAAGGDVWVDGYVAADGTVFDVDVSRPPHGWAAALVCYPSMALESCVHAIDPSAMDDEIQRACDDYKQQLGGSWIFNDVPAESRRCFERFVHSFALAGGGTRRIGFQVRCPARDQ
jgi:hypothetical protein